MPEPEKAHWLKELLLGAVAVIGILLVVAFLANQKQKEYQVTYRYSCFTIKEWKVKEYKLENGVVTFKDENSKEVILKDDFTIQEI